MAHEKTHIREVCISFFDRSEGRVVRGEGAEVGEQRSAQYLSANCVIFTYVAGDISKLAQLTLLYGTRTLAPPACSLVCVELLTRTASSHRRA